MPSARRCAGLLAALLAAAVGAGTARGEDGDFGKIEATFKAERAKVAQHWLDLARDLTARGLRAAALDAVRRAEASDPKAAGIAETRSAAEALESSGTPDAAAEQRIQKAKKEIARCYDRMAEALERETQDERHLESLVAAMGIEPTKARVKAVSDIARERPTLVRSPDHPFSALVSLPPSWKPGREWPVLVVVEGDATWFQGHMNGFLDARGDRPWILVCPQTLSSAVEVKFDRYPGYGQALVSEWNGKRMEFDREGFPVLMEFLRRMFGAAGRFALAAHGKGANFGYRALLDDPARLVGLTITSGEYDPAEVGEARPVEGGGPPVVILTGQDDPKAAEVEARAENAENALRALGFAKVTRARVAGGRSTRAAEIFEALAPGR